MATPALTRMPSSRWVALRDRVSTSTATAPPDGPARTLLPLSSPLHARGAAMGGGTGEGGAGHNSGVLSSAEFVPSKASCQSLCGERRLRRDLDWVVLYQLIAELDISTAYKTLALIRFRRIFEHIDTSYHGVQFYYNRSKCFVITASIINPALLSIATDTATHLHLIIFWTVWAMQLLVSLVTAYVNFYKWDKKYFVYMVYKQRVEQEVWTYLELTGKYGIVNPFNPEEVEGMETTHRSKIKRFLFQLETIYRKLQDTDFGIESTDADADTERIASSNHEREAKQRSSAVKTKIREVESKLAALAAEDAEAEATVRAAEADGTLDATERATVERERARRTEQREALRREHERFRALQMRNHDIDSQIRAMDSNSDAEATAAKRRSSSVATTQTQSTPTPTLLLREPTMPVATVHSTPKQSSRRPRRVPPPPPASGAAALGATSPAAAVDVHTDTATGTDVGVGADTPVGQDAEV